MEVTQSTQKAVFLLPIKLNIELTYDSSFSLLHTYLRESKIYRHRKTVH